MMQINYEIVLIYIISALTLLYCIVSIIMYAVLQRSVREGEELHLTNCSFSVRSISQFNFLPFTYDASFFRRLFLLEPE
jgi:hypothetical protein